MDKPRRPDDGKSAKATEDAKAKLRAELESNESAEARTIYQRLNFGKLD